MAVRDVKIGLKLPFFELSTTWVPNDAERKAAWELLVELVTRTSVTPLAADEGLVREALTSMYSLFRLTREVLKRNGPDVARDKGNGNPSLATIAAVVLNGVLRPVLSKWHPALADHEAARPPGVGPGAWEREWELHDQARAALNDMRQLVRNYLQILGEAAEATEFAAAVRPHRRDE